MTLRHSPRHFQPAVAGLARNFEAKRLKMAMGAPPPTRIGPSFGPVLQVMTPHGEAESMRRGALEIRASAGSDEDDKGIFKITVPAGGDQNSMAAPDDWDEAGVVIGDNAEFVDHLRPYRYLRYGITSMVQHKPQSREFVLFRGSDGIFGARHMSGAETLPGTKIGQVRLAVRADPPSAGRNGQMSSLELSNDLTAFEASNLKEVIYDLPPILDKFLPGVLPFAKEEKPEERPVPPPVRANEGITLRILMDRLIRMKLPSIHTAEDFRRLVAEIKAQSRGQDFSAEEAETREIVGDYSFSIGDRRIEFRVWEYRKGMDYQYKWVPTDTKGPAMHQAAQASPPAGTLNTPAGPVSRFWALIRSLWPY